MVEMAFKNTHVFPLLANTFAWLVGVVTLPGNDNEVRMRTQRWEAPANLYVLSQSGHLASTFAAFEEVFYLHLLVPKRRKKRRKKAQRKLIR